MSEPTTDRLAEIEAREAAATKGPWRARAAKDSFVEEVWDDAGLLARVANGANAAFTAHARADVPWLIDQLKTAREMVCALEEENARLTSAEAESAEAYWRQQIADEIHRAERPTWPATERPDLVARTMRAIDVRIAAHGDDAPYAIQDTDDNRRRIYLDNGGNSWIDCCAVEQDGTRYVVPLTAAPVEPVALDAVTAEVGGLREIGRCW